MTSICSWLMLWVGLLRDTDYEDFQEWLRVDSMNPPIYSPRFNVEGFETVDGGELVHLGPRLKRNPETLVYRLTDGRIIRYQANCLRRTDSHPVARHYYFLKLLKDTQVVPQVYALSGPCELKPIGGETDDFGLSARERIDCFDNDGTVRFMIMEDVGRNIFEWIDEHPGKRLSINVSISIFRDLMNRIKTMHSFGIVHGDIHPFNVMSKKLPEVKLIDLERSKFRSEVSWRLKNRINHVYFSPWEIQGYASSFRDDVFRGVLVGAFLIGGDAWLQRFLRLNKPGMVRLKSDAFLFDIPGVFGIDEVIANRHDQMEIRAHLRTVLRLARDSPFVWSMPHIDGILEALDAILSLLQTD